MAYSIITHITYTDTYIGLFSDSTCVIQEKLANTTSASLIASIECMLANAGLTIVDLAYIGSYQGPGPLTSLRVLLASLNGIQFASGIPLVGVDGLDALLTEYPAPGITVGLFNAYANDLYYAIRSGTAISQKGCKQADDVYAYLRTQYPGKPITFIGQGAYLYRESIQEHFGDQAQFPDAMIEFPSITTIARIAAHNFADNQSTNRLLPLYLKTII